MKDVLGRIEAVLDGLCPCGAEPTAGSAYCGPDCTPTHIAGDTDTSDAGTYGAQSTPMRWRPDLVSAHDDSRLTLSTQFRRSRYNATVYEISNSDGVHCRLDDGNRFVGLDADGYQFVSDEGLEPVWQRLEREFGDSRHLDPDADPRPHRIGEGTRRLVCAWLTANGISPDDVPVWAQIYVTGNTIQLSIVDRDTHGAVQLDPNDQGSILTEERTFPLISRSIPVRLLEAEFVHLDNDALLLVVAEPEAASASRGDDVAAAVHAVEVFRQAREGIAEVFRGALPAFERLSRLMTAAIPQTVSDSEDPMRRALEYRRNRNTGPELRQRAPRQIRPRRGR